MKITTFVIYLVRSQDNLGARLFKVIPDERRVDGDGVKDVT